MKTKTGLKKSIGFSVFLTLMGLLSACGSTEPEVEEPTCRTVDEIEECNADNGEDRGYDPCLVNKDLPVCKS